MLIDAVRELVATGTSGFEGLIQRLLSRLTGYQFFLAQAGTQLGRDMSGERVNATVLAIECKRYGGDTELRQSELLGKVVEAKTSIPRLDVWVLVASREVPDQLYTALTNLAEMLKIDVAVISAGDGPPSTLEVLCAQAPDIVLEYFRSTKSSHLTAIAAELESISRHDDFEKRRDRMKKAFTQASGYEATRQRLREWLLALFGSDVNSRARLGQVVDVDAQQRVGRLVPRTRALTELDEWLTAWPRDRKPLVVLGEEGDGKTWAVAEWACTNHQAPGFPAVLWLPSRDATTQDVDALVGDAFVSRFGGSRPQWLERLRRWSAPGDETAPALILVFDGMNERHEPIWWRPILEALSADPWRNIVASVFTSRTTSWVALKRVPHIICREWTIAPFDDSELAIALKQAAIEPQGFSEPLLALLRKPRYFELAVRHRQAMLDSGDVTEARLIYEDWRDRYTRHAELPDEGAFRDLIMQLARKHREGQQTFERRDLLDGIDSPDERRAVARELETGGIMVQDGRHWRVEPNRLALGFGLLLADELRQAPNDAILPEILVAQLEPQPDIDLKAAILEQAALHSLVTPGFSTTVKHLLLSAWLTHRNHQHSDERTVSAYFPLDPDAYLSAAESIWRDGAEDAWAERLLESTYSRWAAVEAYVPHFVSAFQRWLGFVHVDGSPVAVTPEDRSRRRDSLTAVLGRPLEEGPFEYAGINLTGVVDDDLLRLGRLALAIVSQRDRWPYAKALLTTYVADALMQFPDRIDLCKWIIRTSNDDLWPLLEPEIRRLINVGSNTVMKAAYRILDSLGTKRALALLETLPKDQLFPKSKWYEDFQRDPCSSGFSWPLDACQQCASRDDVPAYLMAQQLSKCVPNPEFNIPETTRSRIVAELRHVGESTLWGGPWQTEHEIRFDTLEPVLARCAPHALGDKLRSVARECAHRSGLSLRQLGHELLHYRVVLTSPELAIIRTTWEAVNQEPRDSTSKEQERAEWALFELLLDDVSPQEQLDLLLRRHRDALVLVRYRPHFKPLLWSEVERQLNTRTDASELSRILFFATAHPEMLVDSAGDFLAKCVSSPDRSVRFTALELIYRGNQVDAANDVVKSEWHYRGDDDSWFEDHWGSFILAQWGNSVPYSELRARIGPAQLGMAVQMRGAKLDEVAAYAEDLHHVWLRIGAIESEPSDEALIEVRSQVVAHSAEVTRPGLASSAFSRSVKFMTRHSTWGGSLNNQPPANFLKPVSDAELEELQSALRDELSRQRTAGNIWFAERFSTDCLKDVITQRRDLLDMWLADNDLTDKRLWLARSFYEGLCDVLLGREPERGARLYARLQKPGAVRFVERGTSIPLLEYVLFRARDSVPTRALWNRRLEEAKTDRDLLHMAILVGSGSSKAWLDQQIAADLASGVPVRKARAVTLLGFLESDPRSVHVPEHSSDIVDWQKQRLEQSVRNWKRNQWARVWFERFLTESSGDGALAAFRLFLSCVDSRFATWSDGMLDRAQESRRSLVMTSGREIEGAIEENEQDLKKHFLGMDVIEDQVWPWM